MAYHGYIGNLSLCCLLETKGKVERIINPYFIALNKNDKD